MGRAGVGSPWLEADARRSADSRLDELKKAVLEARQDHQAKVAAWTALLDYYSLNGTDMEQAKAEKMLALARMDAALAVINDPNATDSAKELAKRQLDNAERLALELAGTQHQLAMQAAAQEQRAKAEAEMRLKRPRHADASAHPGPGPDAKRSTTEAHRLADYVEGESGSQMTTEEFFLPFGGEAPHVEFGDDAVAALEAASDEGGVQSWLEEHLVSAVNAQDPARALVARDTHTKAITATKPLKPDFILCDANEGDGATGVALLGELKFGAICNHYGQVAHYAYNAITQFPLRTDVYAVLTNLRSELTAFRFASPGLGRKPNFSYCHIAGVETSVVLNRVMQMMMASRDVHKLPSRRFGNYELDSLLGRGATSCVFKTTTREFAKVFLPHVTHDEAERECQWIATVNRVQPGNGLLLDSATVVHNERGMCALVGTPVCSEIELRDLRGLDWMRVVDSIGVLHAAELVPRCPPGERLLS